MPYSKWLNPDPRDWGLMFAERPISLACLTDAPSDEWKQMADVWSTITMFNTRSFKILLLRDAICLSLLYNNNKKAPVGCLCDSSWTGWALDKKSSCLAYNKKTVLETVEKIVHRFNIFFVRPVKPIRGNSFLMTLAWLVDLTDCVSLLNEWRKKLVEVWLIHTCMIPKK